MKKRGKMLLAVSLVAIFSFGCGQNGVKQYNLKCPKCGMVFTLEEGWKGVGP